MEDLFRGRITDRDDVSAAAGALGRRAQGQTGSAAAHLDFDGIAAVDIRDCFQLAQVDFRAAADGAEWNVPGDLAGITGKIARQGEERRADSTPSWAAAIGSPALRFSAATTREMDAVMITRPHIVNRRFPAYRTLPRHSTGVRAAGSAGGRSATRGNSITPRGTGNRLISMSSIRASVMASALCMASRTRVRSRVSIGCSKQAVTRVSSAMPNRLAIDSSSNGLKKRRTPGIGAGATGVPGASPGKRGKDGGKFAGGDLVPVHRETRWDLPGSETGRSEQYYYKPVFHRVRLLTCEYMSSAALTTFEFASSARWATIKPMNSSTMLTFDCSSYPCSRCPVLPGRRDWRRRAHPRRR